MRLVERLGRRLARVAGLRIAESISSDTAHEFLGGLHPVDSGHRLIRLGPAGDGGYLVPDDLDGISHCFSPGVGSLSGFETDLASRGITCFLADFADDAPTIDDEKIVFDRRYVGTWTDNVFFTLDDWASTRLPNDAQDLLLQMDIEGAEYAVLLNVSDALLQRFRILIVEFHAVDKWFDQHFYRLVIDPMVNKLLRHFCVVHLHPNNYCPCETVAGISVPPLMEFTFLRRDRCQQSRRRDNFPHALDSDNVVAESVVLPEVWYT